MTNTCNQLADIIVESMDSTSSGTVADSLEQHLATCEKCAPHKGRLIAMANGLDPATTSVSKGFVARVMEEIRGDVGINTAYDRLPPAWQVLGALGLLVALTAVVLATGGTEEWRQQVITGYLNQSLVFLGGLTQTITGLWESVAPGRGLGVFIGCAIGATLLNVGFLLGAIKRNKETVSE